MLSEKYAREITQIYYADIYHFCYLRLRDEDDAHDVAQEVFLVFQQKGETVEKEKIRAWLYSVANKKLKEKFREIAIREKELIFGFVESSTASELVYEIDENFQVSEEEIEKKKKSILAQLSEKELELFEMVYVKRKKYDEVSKELGISENTLRVRVLRLKNKIKSKVSYAFMAMLLLIMRL